MRRVLAAALMAALLLPGCGGDEGTTAAVSSGTAPATSTFVENTAGALAVPGAGLFDVYCNSCHGPGGSETLLVSPDSTIINYGSVAGALAFIRRAMPYENPGSLTAQQYERILAYILVQSKLIAADAAWDDLGSIPLVKGG